MKQLKDLVVGDEIVILDANRRVPMAARVGRVGRKYVYSNLMWLDGFDRETGRMKGDGVGNVHARTLDQHDEEVRVHLAKKACAAVGVRFDYVVTSAVILKVAEALAAR